MYFEKKKKKSLWMSYVSHKGAWTDKQQKLQCFEKKYGLTLSIQIDFKTCMDIMNTGRARGKYAH